MNEVEGGLQLQANNHSRRHGGQYLLGSMIVDSSGSRGGKSSQPSIYLFLTQWFG